MENYKTNVSVCIMINSSDNVLLLRRSNTNYECGKYEFPSGHVEVNETLLEAVVRETKEETGLTININDLSYIGCVDNNKSGKHLNLLFKTNKYIGEPKLIDGEESDDIIWKNIQELFNNYNSLSIDTIRFIDMMKNNLAFKSYTGEESLK